MGLFGKIKEALQNSNRHVTVEGDDFSVADEANLEYGNFGHSGDTIEDSYRPDEGNAPPEAGSGQVG
jgi:hypothetical protein